MKVSRVGRGSEGFFATPTSPDETHLNAPADVRAEVTVVNTACPLYIVAMRHLHKPHYVPPSEYIYKSSNKAARTGFVVVLMVWLFQDLLFRDLFLPVENYRKAHQILDMLSVVWGSFVTGYIFHWIVEHAPSMRKRYEVEVDINRHLHNILEGYRSIFFKTMIDIPRDPDLEGSPYDTLFKGPPELWNQVVKVQPSGFSNNLYKGYYADLFGLTFASSLLSAQRSVADLMAQRQILDVELFDALEHVHEFIATYIQVDATGNPSIRLNNLEYYGMAIRPVYDYVRGEAQKDRLVYYLLNATIRDASYQGIWRNIEEQTKSAEAFTKDLSRSAPPHLKAALTGAKQDPVEPVSPGKPSKDSTP